MPAFHLPLGLRMIEPAMADGDPELDPPGFHPGESTLAARSPRWTVVGQDPGWQSILPETGNQLFLHRLKLLVFASNQGERKPGMVIQHREGIDRPAAQRTISHEIQLPEIVRGLSFE